MKRKVFQIGGVIALMITMTACGNQVQAETMEPTTVVETTMQETTAEPTTEESTAEPTADGSYSGARENGDAFVKLDLPTLSTGKTFDEIDSMQYEIVYDSWSTSSDEEKVALGREGLIDKLGSLVEFTDQEKNEVADYILSKSPIPATDSKTDTKAESKPSSQPTQTQSKPKETQASVQPTAPQPTQSEVQSTEPVVNNDTEMDADELQRKKEYEQWEAEHGPMINNVDSSKGHAGDDLKDADTSHLNIGGM